MLTWGIFSVSVLLNKHGHPPFYFKIVNSKFSYNKYSVDKVSTKIYCHFFFQRNYLKELQILEEESQSVRVKVKQQEEAIMELTSDLKNKEQITQKLQQQDEESQHENSHKHFLKSHKYWTMNVDVSKVKTNKKKKLS